MGRKIQKENFVYIRPLSEGQLRANKILVNSRYENLFHYTKINKGSKVTVVDEYGREYQGRMDSSRNTYLHCLEWFQDHPHLTDGSPILVSVSPDEKRRIFVGDLSHSRTLSQVISGMEITPPPKPEPKKRGRKPGPKKKRGRKPGRPPKKKIEGDDIPKKRGRPPKKKTEGDITPKKRGRPPKKKAESNIPPKKRGRPPKKKDAIANKPAKAAAKKATAKKLAKVAAKKATAKKPAKVTTKKAVAKKPTKAAPKKASAKKPAKVAAKKAVAK